MQETLVEGGLSANVIPTTGSIQNAELIEEGGGMVIGFIQGGIGDLQKSENLIGLASVFYGPIWILYNTDRISNQEAQNQESNSTRRQADLEQLAGKIVYKYYSRLYILEHCTHKIESIESILDELEQLRQEVAKMKTTMRYRKDVYKLRLHINLVRSD